MSALYLPLDDFILTWLSGSHFPPHHSVHLMQLTKQSVISAFLVHHHLADTPNLRQPKVKPRTNHHTRGL